MIWRTVLEERCAEWERRMGPSAHFTTAAAARVARKSQRTIQRHVREGKLRAVGGADRTLEHLRIERLDLLCYLLERDTAVRTPPALIRRFVMERYAAAAAAVTPESNGGRRWRG